MSVSRSARTHLNRQLGVEDPVLAAARGTRLEVPVRIRAVAVSTQ